VEITIASDMERNELFAELSHEDEQWGEIIYDPGLGIYKLEIFPSQAGRTISLNLDEAIRSLQMAKERLQRMGYPPTDEQR